MKKVMMIAAVSAVLSACGGANDGDATTDTTNVSTESPMMDSTSNVGNTPYDSTRDTSSGYSSSPSNPGSRTTTPGGNTNQNDSTRH